ncbi:MAG: DUF5054 domain-containing protein [Methylacidiphilales bacterium]|nr:DUF5054 domain-containing protein [Candidatus Methylacidiphilales bacterium]
MSKAFSDIIVVFKTHLDIGFTDLARKVVARYMEDYIPGALELAKKTRESPNRFVWTTGSWLAYRFLMDADRQGRQMMEEAIEEGDFHWHALPFTTHTELLDPELFRLGLEFSRKLDRRFGRKTIAAKMTDVPGHTRGMVPLLAEAGIRLLHFGVNPTSIVPNVPRIFRWKVGAAEVIVIYEKVYGSTTPLPDGACLAMNLTGDNLGPQNPDEIDKVYEELRRKFSGARVKAGSLDRIAREVWRERDRLPVVTSEIGDTWIHGVGTDPRKMSRFRELSRLRSGWLKTGKLRAGNEVDLAFGEKLLLVAEHTWGMDIKTHLHDEKIWSPRQLSRALNKPNFRLVADSWREQRAYLNEALVSLPATLRTEAKARLRKLEHPSRPPVGRSIKSGESFTLGQWEIAIDPTGAISRLKRESRVHADAVHRLGALTYQTFSEHDYKRFYRQYCRLDIDWAFRDFTKPGMTGSVSACHRPLLRRIELARNGESARAILGFPSAARQLGAPATVILQWTPTPDGLDLRLDWENKPANRLPEALWLQFQPCLTKTDWRFEKLGQKIDPVDVVRGGNRHLHAVSGAVTADGFSLNSLDAVLIAPGEPNLLNFTNKRPSLNKGITSVLHNNLWGTNFPQWYSDPASFRYEVRWKGRPTD